jgi:hypothetical protein
VWLWFDIVYCWTARFSAGIVFECGPRKYPRKFYRKFRPSRFPTKQASRNITKIRSTGSVLNSRLAKERHVLTEEKLDRVWTRLDHTSLKSLRGLAQETGVSKSFATKTTNLLNLWPYKVTLSHVFLSVCGFRCATSKAVCSCLLSKYN